MPDPILATVTDASTYRHLCWVNLVSKGGLAIEQWLTGASGHTGKSRHVP